MLTSQSTSRMDASFASIATAITMLNNDSASRSLTPCDISATLLNSPVYIASNNAPSSSTEVFVYPWDKNSAKKEEVQGIDNQGFNTEEKNKDDDSDSPGPSSFVRSTNHRASKRSLEFHASNDNGILTETVKKFSVVPCTSKYEDDEKLMSAFEKTVASITGKRGNFRINNRVVAESSTGAKEMATNTENSDIFSVNGYRELHKSFSVGCLIGKDKDLGPQTPHPCNLHRSESFDGCAKIIQGHVTQWHELSPLQPPPPYPHEVVVDMPNIEDVVVKTAKKPPMRAQSTQSSCSSYRSDCHVCRICWLGEEKEGCIQPCNCSGSSAFVHVSCLQRWLSVTQNFKCEICLYEFQTKKKLKPVKKWHWKLAKSRQRSQLEATMILLAIVTPPLICGIILCSQKIAEFLAAPDQTWSSTGMPLALITLVLASSVTYLVAVFYFLRKLGVVCRQWMNNNKMTIVQLGEHEHVVDSNKEGQQIWTVA